MTRDELYDYITSQMTAEDALKKFLEASLLVYDKLKFEKGDEPVHPVQIIAMAACDMGWQIAIENDKENIEGITIGTEKYMKRVFK